MARRQSEHLHRRRRHPQTAAVSRRARWRNLRHAGRRVCRGRQRAICSGPCRRSGRRPRKPASRPYWGWRRRSSRARASEDVLFPNQSGEPHTSGSVGNQLREREARMPIDKFNTHDLRRSAATMMTKLGLSLELVATIVGHTAGGAGTTTLGSALRSRRIYRSKGAWPGAMGPTPARDPGRRERESGRAPSWIERAKIMQPESTT